MTFCYITIYADDANLSSNFPWTSDSRQQLELVSELESDPWDSVT